MDRVSRNRNRCEVENNNKNSKENQEVNEVKRIIDKRKLRGRGRPKKNTEERTSSSLQSSQTSSTNSKTIRRSNRERKTRVL